MKARVIGAAERLLPQLWALGGELVEEGARVEIVGDAGGATEGTARVLWTSRAPAGLPEGVVASVHVPPGPPVSPAAEPAEDAEVEVVVAALRAMYARELPRLLSELARALGQAHADAAARAEARTLAHRLHGTAGSYGHPEVGVAAGRVEALVQAEALDRAALAEALQDAAMPVVAAIWPEVQVPASPRVLVLGDARRVARPGVNALGCDAAALVRRAGEADALWLPANVPASGLRGRRVALVRADAPADAITAALACLVPSPWSALLGPDWA